VTIGRLQEAAVDGFLLLEDCRIAFWSFARDGGALASSFLRAIWQFHTILSLLCYFGAAARCDSSHFWSILIGS
jgi:hypothetical protein